MIEQLLQTGKGQATLDWSGPGVKTLKFGNEDLGYFGTVTDDELFTTNEVLDFTGLTAGNTITGTSYFWFKFILKGRVIYIRSFQMKTTASWADLYKAGLIYGTTDNGVFPLAPPVKQLKWKIKEEGDKKWFLKARTMTGAGIDPYTDVNSDPERIGSEFDELLGRVCLGSSPDAGKWEKYQLAVLGIVANVYDITANTNRDSTTAALIRAYGSITGTNVTKTQALSSDRWRPVLELFDGSILVIPPEEIVGAGKDGIVAPQTLTAAMTPATASNPQAVFGEFVDPIAAPKSFTATLVEPVLMAISVKDTVDFKPINLKLTTV